MAYQTILSGLVLFAAVATAQAAPMLLASSTGSDGAVSLEQQENHLVLVLQEDACARVRDHHADNGAGQSLFLHGVHAESAPGTTYRIYLEVSPGTGQGKPMRIKVGELNFYGLVAGVGRNVSFIIPSKTIRTALQQPACEIRLVAVPNKPVAQGSRPGIDRVELWLLSPSSSATK